MTYQERITEFKARHYYQKITVNGAEFRCLLCGKGEKTLVFLVGGMGVSEMWMPYIEAFEDSCRILTFDYPMELKDNRSLAHGIDKLLEASGIERAVLIGSSYGGYLAQIVARLHPERVEAVCLFSTAGLTVGTLAQLGKRYRMAGVLVGLMKILPYSWLKPIFYRACMKHIVDATPEEYRYMEDMFRSIYRDYTKEFDLHMTMLLLDILNQPPCDSAEFAYLDGHVLLILPDRDDTFTPDMQRELIELMPKPVVVQMDGGHLATMLRIDSYVTAIRLFLEKNL